MLSGRGRAGSDYMCGPTLYRATSLPLYHSAPAKSHDVDREALWRVMGAFGRAVRGSGFGVRGSESKAPRKHSGPDIRLLRADIGDRLPVWRTCERNHCTLSLRSMAPVGAEAGPDTHVRLLLPTCKPAVSSTSFRRVAVLETREIGRVRLTIDDIYRCESCATRVARPPMPAQRWARAQPRRFGDHQYVKANSSATRLCSHGSACMACCCIQSQEMWRVRCDSRST